MDTLKYMIMLFFLGSCSAAQNFDLVKTSHSVTLGGVKGARSEQFEIAVKENTSLQPDYLLVGNVKIDLTQEKKDGIIYLKGTLYPEHIETVSEEGIPTKARNGNNFDLAQAFLVSKNVKNQKKISQKINFPEDLHDDDSLPLGDVPQ